MNRFDSVKLGASASDVCGKCGMHTEDSNGCCHDEIEIIKLQEDQQTASVNYQFTSPEILVPSYELFTEVKVNNVESATPANSHSPPPNEQDTYLQNCVFRI